VIKLLILISNLHHIIKVIFQGDIIKKIKTITRSDAMKRLATVQVFAIALLSFLPLSSRAEYYVVYPGTVYYTQPVASCGSCCKRTCYSRCNPCPPPRPRCNPCCGNPCGNQYIGYGAYGDYGEYNSYFYETPPVVYLNYVSPARHSAYRGSEEVAEYAWVPYP